MCPHNDWDIIHYEYDILVRRCKGCGEIEVSTLGWANIQCLQKVVYEIVMKEEEGETK